ncbi:hypothetical protein GJ629_10620 [Halapricum sp. CBA1109]|uniref:hypothetical protein n=1 Tax=Halapricum sp. CBA1109 TaxID=2668068 RepID=UPI0012F76EEB|nr:hypothetical protein [Halapricum sp. CBA1109]MUV90291.1 hypothetical protein [Halapricum sp. CBA1109]
MAVTVGTDVLARYRRFTLYDSPYAAHDAGRAVDLYPDPGTAPAPVGGEVVGIREVRAPPRPYAADRDWLIVLDTGERLARILHVEPSVAVGDTVVAGDSLGETVRAGFFAPWVPDHLHVGFRPHGADTDRAAGSLPITIDADLRPLSWDGTGTVVAAGETWARLDAPAHPDPGEYFVGLGSDGGVLDGGLPHYEHGGLLGGGDRAVVAGTEVGAVTDGRVRWHDLTVRANGDPVTGIALCCARERFGVKLVGEGVNLDVGAAVRVRIDRTD